MPENALRTVVDACRSDIARRALLIEAHRAALAELDRANAADAAHVAAGEALIEHLAAAGAPMPDGDIRAAALIGHVLTVGMPSLGKSAAARLTPFGAPSPR